MAESLFEEHTNEFLKPYHKHIISSINVTNTTLITVIFHTVMWIGWWNILDGWFWPWRSGENDIILRDFLYIIMGVTLKFIGVLWFPEEEITHGTVVAWQLGMPRAFSWNRKIRNFGISYLHFVAFLLTWVGMWNIFDIYIYFCNYCWQRDLVFLLLPPILLFFFQEVLSMESLYWLFTTRKMDKGGEEEKLVATKAFEPEIKGDDAV